MSYACKKEENPHTQFAYPRSPKDGDLGTRFKDVRAFRIELEFGTVGFRGGRKTGEPRRKTLGAGTKPTTNIKT